MFNCTSSSRPRVTDAAVKYNDSNIIIDDIKAAGLTYFLFKYNLISPILRQHKFFVEICLLICSAKQNGSICLLVW